MTTKILVFLMLLSPTAALALHTPGGVTWTQEELAIWQARSTDGGTYQTIYNTLKSGADACVSSCTTALWDGVLQDGSHTVNDCIYSGSQNESSNGTSLGLTKGRNLMLAGFVYLVAGTTSYRDAVESQLLTQAAVTGTDFSRTVHWCPNSGNWTQSTLWIANWLWKLALAYDYIRADISSGNRATLDAWFSDAMIYWTDIEGDVVHDQNFSGRPSDYSSCDGSACPGALKGDVEYLGDTAYGFHIGGWDNQHSQAMGAAALISLIVGNSTYQDWAKAWFYEVIQFATFSDGAPSDQYRWNDNPVPNIASGWGHMGVQVCQWENIANMFARAGDFDLVNYSTSNGFYGTDGGPKSILTVMQHIAHEVNGTITVYAGTSEANKEVFDHTDENGHVEDICGNKLNIYYRDADVETAVTRSAPASPSCGGYYCWGEPWGGTPDMRFIGKDLGGVVYPYIPKLRIW